MAIRRRILTNPEVIMRPPLLNLSSVLYYTEYPERKKKSQRFFAYEWVLLLVNGYTLVYYTLN